MSKECEVKSFEDALKLIFENLVPKDTEGGGFVIEVVPEDALGDCLDEEENEYIRERQVVFDMMTDDELAAYDRVESYLLSSKKVLPEDDRSIFSRVEHADWNNDDLQGEAVHSIAELEASIAYYITVKTSGIYDDDEAVVDMLLADIQEQIKEVKKIAREIELLVRLEIAKFTVDTAEESLNELTEQLKAATEEKEILEQQLEDFYAASASNDES